MRAVILAGGKGRRLYPYTLVLPKPLVPLGEMPIIEVVMRQLAAHGFERITIAVGYHAELIMAVMEDGKKWGLEINYSLESKPLGTVGPLKKIKKLDEPFLVMNGDLLTDIHYEDIMAYHKQQGCIATVATCKRHVQISLGVLQYNQDNRIHSFQEKPEFDYDVSMGVYIFDPRILDYIPDDEHFGFDDLMLRLLDAKEDIAAFPFSGHWLDMGTPEDLTHASEEFEKHRKRYLPNG
ncbi:MAG: sugar phosphate nucleotidyltransferase [Candidatus Hinthialibacter antarcticus]|nr:sugar phosphate nucleotidyltransferase [Candidatus Hinthialibacter antarcticus]